LASSLALTAATSPDTVELLFVPNARGVVGVELNRLEAMCLDMCDGRPVAAAAAHLAAATNSPTAVAIEAMFRCLVKLANTSVVALHWS
jgi:hypothetical protein